jgi:hypothetical protein
MLFKAVVSQKERRNLATGEVINPETILAGPADIMAPSEGAARAKLVAGSKLKPEVFDNPDVEVIVRPF